VTIGSSIWEFLHDAKQCDVLDGYRTDQGQATHNKKTGKSTDGVTKSRNQVEFGPAGSPGRKLQASVEWHLPVVL